MAGIPPLTPEEEAQAGQVHRAHAQGVREVRNDGRLSATGRGEALDDIYDQAEGKLDALYARAGQREQADGQQAYRQLFGVPAGADSSMVLAHRDARDRLANADAAETGRLLNQGLQHGDETLVRAAGERAFHMTGPADLGSHYGRVLETFASSTPQRQRLISQLAGQVADRRDSQAATRASMLRHVRKPVEIQHGNARQRAAARRAAAQGNG